jgi:hypothetical protein
MIWKAVGSLLLLLAGGYLSLAISHFERRRLRVLDGYISLIYYMKGQIDCYALPLSDILERADPAVLAACLGLEPREALPAIPESGSAALSHMVEESRLYLEPESERLLRGLSGELGGTFRTEQVTRCQHYLDALTRERDRLNATLPARLRATCTLCLCVAVAVAVLLW